MSDLPYLGPIARERVESEQERRDYVIQLEAENTTLARRTDALHKWFARRPDSDQYDTALAEWYARGQRIFLLKEDESR